MTNEELYIKLKDKLRVLDFSGGRERSFILSHNFMIFNYGIGGYKSNGYRCKNINKSAKLLYWSPNCDRGRQPTYSEFIRLYELE